jgi:hypothetical protein
LERRAARSFIALTRYHIDGNQIGESPLNDRRIVALSLDDDSVAAALKFGTIAAVVPV